MSLKRGADPSFIKPDPDKRVKREGGVGDFILSSIPMAPPRAAFASTTSSAVAPKIEGGDRKPLAPAPNFGGNPGNNRKKKFFGNTIKVTRGDDWVSAHFNKRTMTVHFVMHCPLTKQWSSVRVEQEIFERLNKAKFDIQPSDDWGFLDRKFLADLGRVRSRFSSWDAGTTDTHFDWKITLQPASSVLHYTCEVRVSNMSAEKVENSSSYFKKEDHLSQPKNERFE